MAQQSLVGKTALITGAAKRIGRATASALAKEGANIVVHYNSSAGEAEDLSSEIKSLGVDSWTVKADFSKPDEYESLIDRTLEITGSLDILVNNASIFPTNRIEDVTYESVVENFQINAWVPFVLSRSFAKRVVHGTIVNLVDSRVYGYDWAHVAYIWSKHVLDTMTKMIAFEFAPNITVNGVYPGLILPPPDKDESYLERLKDTVPLKRYGDAEDIADAIVFLAKSTFISGVVLFVDGGRHLKECANG